MPKVFWVQCPRCHREYYVSTLLKGKEVDLMCPFCHLIFKESEAGSVRA